MLAKQKSLTSRTEIVKRVAIKKDTPKQVNERTNLDISTIKAPVGVKVTVKKPQWLIMVESRTEMKWAEFYESKNGYAEPACVKFQQWREAGMPIKIFRCDNAARDTPQQNSLAEVSFFIIGNHSRAMMIA
eukprot:13878236-Ditylum_brightwellii.AAC.1